MNRKQLTIITALMVLASFLGGMVASKICNPKNIWAQTGGKIITAEEFRVIDKAGEIRAVFKVDVFGMPTFESPILWMYDKAGKVRFAIGQLEDGSPGLSLNDKAGTPRIQLVLEKDGLTGLRLADKAGITRTYLSLSEDGSPSLSLLDNNIKSRAVLGSTSLKNTRTGSIEIRAISSLVLFDENDKVIWKAP